MSRFATGVAVRQAPLGLALTAPRRREFRSPQTVLKTAGLSFMPVHQRPPTFNREPPWSVIVRRYSKPSIRMAVNFGCQPRSRMQSDQVGAGCARRSAGRVPLAKPTGELVKSG